MKPIADWRRGVALVLCWAVTGCAADMEEPTADAGADGPRGMRDGLPPVDGPRHDGGSSGGARPAITGAPFSIVLLPDTQYYVQSYLDMFESQVRWIAQEKQARTIELVLHHGDIVETPTAAHEWQRADGVLRVLDGVVPYVLSAGNHDILVDTREAPLMNQTFPVSRFAPRLKETFEPDKVQNTLHEVTLGGQPWLVLALEFGPRDETLAWAHAVLQARPATPAILVTHAYMYIGDKRYDRTLPAQHWNPHGYPLPGSINDGEEMWQKLVSLNDNVVFVFSGHATYPGGALGRLSTRRASGIWVHEMLVNYQGCPSDYMCFHVGTTRPVRGGEGFLRVLRIEPAERRALIETYSPYLNEHKTDPESQFEITLVDPS